MLILIHSETNQSTIRQNLGKSEYSYYFVLKEFRPVLERLGRVVEVTDPDTMVDVLYDDCQRRGEDCVFLSFSPPHRTPIHYRCPTIPVFAWEFSTIPNEAWQGEPRNDWRLVFEKLGAAITHSSFTVDTVRASMGSDYPIVSVPAPVWNRFAAQGRKLERHPRANGVEIQIDGLLLDSQTVDVMAYGPPAYRSGTPVDLKAPAARQTLRLDGVVYTSVFNPCDGRKNWIDMIAAFCWSFRDTPDATLVLKLTHFEASDVLNNMLHHLYKHHPHRCRVVLVHGYLADVDYERLVQATSYAVNTGYGEGQCLPLMEFMSCGKPAIAPSHTAMLDYLDTQNAFVVDCSEELTAWPHDPRAAYRALRYIPSWDSLVEAFSESYRVANQDVERYARMSEQATASLQAFCSQEQAEHRLKDFIQRRLAMHRQSQQVKTAPVGSPCSAI